MAYLDEEDNKISKTVRDPVLAVSRWIKKRNSKERTMLGVLAGILFLVLLWLVVEDHDNLFVMAEAVHFLGIGILVYKLQSKKNSGGLSLRSQELTALFLVIRLFCSFMMEYDIHTLLDFLTLLATCWVIYTLRIPLQGSYQADQDTIQSYYVAIPCLILALLAHPGTAHPFALRNTVMYEWNLNLCESCSIFLTVRSPESFVGLLVEVLWASCVYVEAVSVLPQLRMMQNAKVVEKFTAHYVFALGFSRLISCAHWILQIIDGDSFLLQAIGSGLWPAMVLLSEIVQTFILADFCYYYVKSYTEGTGIIQLPAGIV